MTVVERARHDLAAGCTRRAEDENVHSRSITSEPDRKSAVVEDVELNPIKDELARVA
jgi:hypothetical protein